MVVFEAIGILTEQDWVLMFSTLDVFDSFRKYIWKDVPNTLALLITSVAHYSLEREFDRRFRLPPRSLDGACLIFGTKKETLGRLSNEDIRDILSDPETRATLKVCLPDEVIKTLVTDKHGQTYEFDYPMSQALIPSGTPLRTRYFEFSADKLSEIIDNNMMIF